MQKTILLLLISSLSVLMINCKHEFPITSTAGNVTDTLTSTSNCSADTVYFANEILPLINSNCATSGCHDAVSHREGITLTNYANIRSSVSPFNAATSKLYKVCARSGGERMPPSPMAAFNAAQLHSIIVWINQGALNNQCSGGCDTTLFTYSGAVAVTMNTFCKGCHNPASLGGGIDLSNYAAVKSAVAGRLMGSIVHTAGYSAMPKGSNKLQDCQIRQIEKWIQSGTPNN